MQQTPHLDDVTPFENAVHLQSSLLQNIISVNRSVATIKAVHSGPNASKASSDNAGGLDPIVHLAHAAWVMLTANLWIEV